MIKISILGSVFFILGCTKTFQPEKSTCSQIEKDLYEYDTQHLNTTYVRPKYDLKTISRFRKMAKYCESETKFSASEYKTYMSIVYEINELNDELDHVFEEGMNIGKEYKINEN